MGDADKSTPRPGTDPFEDIPTAAELRDRSRRRIGELEVENGGLRLENDRLRAAHDALVAALKPFAALAGEVARQCGRPYAGHPDACDPSTKSHCRLHLWGVQTELTVGACQRAAAALKLAAG